MILYIVSAIAAFIFSGLLAMGKMKVAALRNVAKRPSASFIKAYGHSGYFKSFIVAFLKTLSDGCTSAKKADPVS